MAAAYASVVTLMHTIEQIQLHLRPPISLDKNHVQSLSQNLTFLQEFLEDDSWELADGLVSRIADAAYAAEDIIESGVVDKVLFGEKKFHEYLQKAVDGMDLIKNEAMKIKETITTRWIQTPLRSSFTGQNVVVVGFEDVLIELKDKLTSEESYRQIIPIVGMGGIGKTTLARTVYSSMLNEQHFDVCAWTTISHDYNLKQILIEVLSQVSKGVKDDLSEKSEEYLKEALHKNLFGRRYLIIIDDIWKMEVWEDIQLFFPDCDNKSRVIITTRLSSLANQLVDDSCCLKMKFLDFGNSWDLFRKVVFGEEDCPVYLEGIGKEIAEGCKGLPLSISVIGGLLAKSKYEVEYWEYVAKNITYVVNSESNEHCLKILHMSYSQLPIHLQPCFLYVGVFPEDKKIRVSELIELWVDEGFLKPIGGKPPEVVAQEYLHELIDRNLILVHEMGSIGNIKYCKIHDLLRDLCLREARQERFHNVLELHSLHSGSAQDVYRKVVPLEWSLLLKKKFHYGLQSIQLFHYSWQNPTRLNSRLVRIWTKCHQGFAKTKCISGLSTSQCYLSTLNEQNSMLLREPIEIWKMPQLKHVRSVGMLGRLPDPPFDHIHDIVLENLQTLSRVVNFKCSDEIIKRIRNIKKLRVYYSIYAPGGRASCDFISNIEQLGKLESFAVSFMPNDPGLFQNLTFPNSLKKLTIRVFQADEFLGKIGSLSHLVKLKLVGGFFNQREWVTAEGQFCSLRFLLIKECFHLKCWKTESSHFPCLERLTLESLKDLQKIPSDIGEIPTLESIHVKWCCKSVVNSARKIKKEQEKLGNVNIQVRVEL